MGIIFGLANILRRKVVLAVAAAATLASVTAGFFLFLEQGPADVVTVSYSGAGVSSDQRTDVTFEEYLLDKQLSQDAIPPIYHPSFIPGRQALLHDQSYVIGLEINGEAKAYQIDELNFREMVNDTVGGVPVLVTW